MRESEVILKKADSGKTTRLGPYLSVLRGSAEISMSSDEIMDLTRGENHELAINPLIYSEVSVSFKHIEEVERVIPAFVFKRLHLPWEAAFLAGKAFLRYRKRQGKKSSPLPDFYIGAHSTVLGIPLITRDKKRFQSYFPRLQLIAP